MAGWTTKYLKSQHSHLAHIVGEMNGSRCPCCKHPMVTPRKKNLANVQRRDRKTVAHNAATSFGGDDTVWVYACNGCNNDQGNRTFRSWSQHLDRLGDPRAANVRQLAAIVETYIDTHRGPRHARLPELSADV